MAGPIKIAILADAAKAVKEVTKFSDVVDSETKRVVTTLGDSKLQGGFGKVQEGFDVAEQRAMGFRDTITGVQDSMRGFKALTTSTSEATKKVADAQKAYDDAVARFGKESPQAIAASTQLSNAQGELANQQASLGDKLLLVGTGVGDLASGFANFIVPLVAVGAGLKTFSIGSKAAAAGQWLLNAAMAANPILIVVVAIIALVAILVVAYKKSETFRRIVDGAFKGVLRAASATWNWIKRNWPLLLAIITGPIGLAVRWVVRNWDRITATARAIPGKIKAAFSGANRMLVGAGRAIVQGLWNGITGLAGWLAGKVRSFIESTVPGPIRRALGIASPSKVARALGRFTGQGLGLGLDDERSRVQAAAGRLAGAAVPVASRGRGASLGGTVAPVAERRLDLSDSEIGRLILKLVRDAARRQGLGDVQFVATAR